MSTQHPDFSELSMAERLRYLAENTSLTAEDLSLLQSGHSLPVASAEKMVESVVGTYALPYSIAPGFLINGKDYTVPMVGEEPYVTKSTTKGAYLARKNGGFTASDTGSIMIGQVQVTHVSDPFAAKLRILEHKADLIEIANAVDPLLVSLGGGCFDVDAKVLDSLVGPMLVVYLLIDVKDAMGAQAINAMAEAVSSPVELLSEGTVNICVLSNLAVHRLVRVRTQIAKEDLGGEENVDKVVSAYAFAAADPFRATTNNKGVMNGIIPVVVATGNDTRAVESGVHSYASYGTPYRPITVWEKSKSGDLVGSIEIPLAIGTVGGTTKLHPLAQMSLKLLDIHSAPELARVIASVGLAANLGVLHSLVTAGLFGDFNSARS